MNEKHVVTKNANNTEKDITLNEKVSFSGNGERGRNDQSCI